MKKAIIIFLKAVMLFITAVWGVLFGVWAPVAMLSAPEESGLPSWVYVMWLIVSVAGFIIPCFLIMLKAYKTATALIIPGTAALFVMRYVMSNYEVMNTAILYMPLLLETVAVILVSVFSNSEKISKKLRERREYKNAPSPSVLGDGLYDHTVSHGEHTVSHRDKINKERNINKSRKKRGKA
jgi:hypothetical protein